MTITLKIEKSTTIELSEFTITKVNYIADPKPDSPDNFENSLKSLVLEGRIPPKIKGSSSKEIKEIDDVLELGRWALLLPNHRECYRDLTLKTVTYDNILIQNFHFKYAYSDYYEEAFQNSLGYGTFKIRIRESIASIEYNYYGDDELYYSKDSSLKKSHAAKSVERRDMPTITKLEKDGVSYADAILKDVYNISILTRMKAKGYDADTNPDALEKLTFTKNNVPIMYTNYPEFMNLYPKDKTPLGMAFADNIENGKGFYINQQDFNAGEAYLFFSHNNKNGNTGFYYGIQIFNPDVSNDVKIQILHYGFSKGYGNIGTEYKNFYRPSKTVEIIKPTDVYWILDEEIPKATYPPDPHSPFTGTIHIRFDRPIKVTNYAYRGNKFDIIKGDEVAFPYDLSHADKLNVYSGRGEGCKLTTNIDIKVSNLKKKDYYYFTNQVNRNINEMVDIKLVGTSPQLTTTSDINNVQLSNIGNWTIQYEITATITNDTEETKDIYGYVGSNPSDNTVVIFYKDLLNKDLWNEKLSNEELWNEDELGIRKLEHKVLEGKNRSWKWLHVHLIKGKSITVKYRVIMASYGAAPIAHLWSLDDFSDEIKNIN